MPRILIIDNDEGSRESIAIFCEMLGNEPNTDVNPAYCDVYSPSPCTCTKETACTDILLIEQNMPGMSGMELIQRQLDSGCKSVAHGKAIMSRALTVEETQLASELGCHVLQKPVTYEALEHLLSSIEDENQTLVEAG